MPPRRFSIGQGLAQAAAVLAVGLAALTLGKDAAADSPKRAVPDYDGRGGEPTTAGDVAVWTLRVVLSPLYFVSEFLIRRPLGFLIAGAERARLPQALYDFFFFGPDHRAGFVPTAFVDFGFSPSVGLYAFWDDAGFKGNDVRIHGSVWDKDWLAGSLSERIRFNGQETLALRVAGNQRPDQAFFGLGSESLQSNLGRFGERRFEASAMLSLPFWRASRLEAGSGFRSVDLYHGNWGQDPSIEYQVAHGVFARPYGFDRGYSEPYSRTRLTLDTRAPRPASGSGLRIEVGAEEGSDVRRRPEASWIRWGGTAGVFYDINGLRRVVSLSATALFADPMGRDAIPFTELVSLGGDDTMRGLFPGRLVDRSAAVASFRYRWPIWTWLDGTLQADAGNVFGPHEQGFKPGLLRFSGALGIESVGGSDSAFDFLVGLGTETFDQGAHVDSARVVVATNRGF